MSPCTRPMVCFPPGIQSCHRTLPTSSVDSIPTGGVPPGALRGRPRSLSKEPRDRRHALGPSRGLRSRPLRRLASIRPASLLPSLPGSLRGFWISSARRPGRVNPPVSSHRLAVTGRRGQMVLLFHRPNARGRSKPVTRRPLPAAPSPAGAPLIPRQRRGRPHPVCASLGLGNRAAPPPGSAGSEPQRSWGSHSVLSWRHLLMARN